MSKKVLLYLDQYGNRYFANSVEDLKRQVGGTRASKMYVDGKDGGIYCVGYVIKGFWLSAYEPIRIKQK